MHMGGMKFKQRGREEQAEADGTEVNQLDNEPKFFDENLLLDYKSSKPTFCGKFYSPRKNAKESAKNMYFEL